MTTIKLTFIFLVLAWQAYAQELWMEPDKFFCKAGDSLTVEFNAGRNFNRKAWNLTDSKISKLQWIDFKGAKNIKANEGATKHIKWRVSEEGTKLVVMQGVPASIKIEAEQFNEYLKKYGLDEAYAFRKSQNSLDKPGNELYERTVKVLIQVGVKKDDSYKKIVGLPLEILPISNPYSWKVGDMARFKILFEGKPLFGARVFVWNRSEGRTFMQPVYTLQDGTIEMRLSDKGPWMISLVKMVPSKQPEADWKSYWGTLVFGVR